MHTDPLTMPTFSQLPSGKWRVQVRRAGLYRAATFAKKREAQDWAAGIESQVTHAAAGQHAPPPKGATLGDLVDKYGEIHAKTPGKTKAATHAMLKRELGAVQLGKLHKGILTAFVDRRRKQGAGGVTIAADLSFLSAILKWARSSRNLDVPAHLPAEVRASLHADGLETRSHERTREPSDDELARLYVHWQASPRQRIDMPTLCRFALATAMRLGEICRIAVEDVDLQARTVIIRDRKDPKRKLGNDQTVPLLPDAWTILEPLLEGRDAGAIFDAQAESVSAAFTRACKAVKPRIEDLHFHDLRHRATAGFFRMGLSIPQVALLTGHKTWAMLRRYTDIKPADVHATIAQAAKKPRKRAASPAPQRS